MNFSLRNATNETVLTLTRIYLTCAIRENTLFTLTMTLGTVCLLGIISNSVIIHLTKNQTTFDGQDQERQRRALVNYFIYNLAVSDLCGCLVSGPSLMIQMYTQRHLSHMQCRVHRGLVFVFPFCAIFLVMSISIERYFTLANPLKCLTASKCKVFIKLSWVMGVLWAVLFSTCYKGYERNLDATFYTTDCVYESENFIKRLVFLVAMMFTFVFPTIIIFFTTARSACLIRKTCSQNGEELRGQPTAHAKHFETKLLSTRMLMIVILAFGCSYIPYIAITFVRLIAGPNYTSYTNDSIVRYAVAICGYSNAVINPIIYLSIMKSLRTKLKKLLRWDGNVTVQPLGVSEVATFHQEFVPSHGVALVPILPRIQHSPPPAFQNLDELMECGGGNASIDIRMHQLKVVIPT